MWTKQHWEHASDASIHNRITIQNSQTVACYHCLRTFKASQVVDFVDEHDDTAVCPHCGIDAILGDATGFPIENAEYLKAIHDIGFGSSGTLPENAIQSVG